MWMRGVASFAFLVLLVRLYQVQVLHGEDYRERAEDNFVKDLRVPADRGLIVDRNHRVLVDSRPSYDVSITPKFCPGQCEETISRLTAMFSLSQEEVERASQRLREATGLERFRPFTVKVDVRREELDVFEANRLDLAGVDVMPTPHRNYRYGSMAGHLVGYMNEVGSAELKALNAQIEASESDEVPYQIGDYVGRRGIERRFESVLRGVEGVRRVVVDAKGNAKDDSNLLPEGERGEPPQPGTNLVLSIDWRLQEFAEKAFPAKAGVVIAMDPKTGFILAMVDRPAPDPNKLSGRISAAELAAIHSDPLQPELFRSIQQHYHPGSTFKVVTAIAALEEGVFRRNGAIFCPGYYIIGNHRWRCDRDEGHGLVNLTHALGASCDVFFYALGDRLGADRIAKWGGLLGLGRLTGFDVQGEVPGVMPDEAWHDEHLRGGYQHGMAVNLAIGQGDLNVTPIQQAVLYAALASGIVWKPQVVMRMEDTQGKLVKEFAPVERWRLSIKPETRSAVLEGLEAAVNEPYGTGYFSRLQDTDIVMAGKTGTAQVVKLGAKRLKASQVDYFHRDHAWFAAFAPVDDPQIVVVVLNEHSGFGSTNAAPTASALVKYWLELQAQDALERAGVPRPPEPPAVPGSGSGSAPAPDPGRTPGPVRARAADLRGVSHGAA
jgi:penicillin-binding protein 2